MQVDLGTSWWSNVDLLSECHLCFEALPFLLHSPSIARHDARDSRSIITIILETQVKLWQWVAIGSLAFQVQLHRHACQCSRLQAQDHDLQNTNRSHYNLRNAKNTFSTLLSPYTCSIGISVISTFLSHLRRWCQPAMSDEHCLGNSIAQERCRGEGQTAYFNNSNSLYFLKYFVPLRYALIRSAGCLCLNVRPMSFVTFWASWNIGSKTTRFLEPSRFFSNPTIVIEWPVYLVTVDSQEARRVELE